MNLKFVLKNVIEFFKDYSVYTVIFEKSVGGGGGGTCPRWALVRFPEVSAGPPFLVALSPVDSIISPSIKVVLKGLKLIFINLRP